MFSSKKTIAAAVASQILIHSFASAQPMLEEVVVTAQKREQNMQDVGISVTAMSGDNLRSLGITNSADIASFTPNLSIVSLAGEGNQPVIFLRGIGLNDYNTNNAGPIGMYVDEVIISSPTAQSFAMFDVERVEVLRGPQGTLYGRNTTGGAINVISNKPTGEFEAYLLTSHGNYNAVKLEGAVGGTISDTLGARQAGLFEHFLLVPDKPLIFLRAFLFQGNLRRISGECLRQDLQRDITVDCAEVAKWVDRTTPVPRS